MHVKPLAAAAAFLPSLAHAAPITYFADLNGANESPPVVSSGTGWALVTIDTVGHFLSLNVSFSGLEAPVTVAHIHCCTLTPFTGNVGVATATPTFPGFPAGVTSGSYENTFDTTALSTFSAAFVTANGGTAAGAGAALAAGLAAGRAHLNIHTSLYPGGEIRGFLRPVPEPGTLALAGATLVWLVWRLRALR